MLGFIITLILIYVGIALFTEFWPLSGLLLWAVVSWILGLLLAIVTMDVLSSGLSSTLIFSSLFGLAIFAWGFKLLDNEVQS